MRYCRSILLVGFSVGFVFSLAFAQASHDAASNAQLASPEIEQKVDTLLKRMTFDEKIGQLVQYSATEAHPAKLSGPSTAALNVNPPGPGGIDSYALAQKGELGSMLNTVGQSLTNHFQHAAVDNTRLHIPLLFGADVIHGFRTIFPVPLATASSWDPALVTVFAGVLVELMLSMSEGASAKVRRDSFQEAEKLLRTSPLLGLRKYKFLHLDLSGTTVDEEFDSVDEAGIAGGEEEGDGRDLLRASQFAAWDLGFEELFGLFSEGIEDRRVDGAGTEDVHADSALFELKEPGAGERANRSLAGAVDAERRKALDAGDGAIEKDRAVVVEERESLLHGEQRATDVEIEGLVEVFLGDFFELCQLTEAGAGEKDVDLAFFALDRLIETIEVGQV